jgi:hypothetical protein
LIPRSRNVFHDAVRHVRVSAHFSQGSFIGDGFAVEQIGLVSQYRETNALVRHPNIASLHKKGVLRGSSGNLPIKEECFNPDNGFAPPFLWQT